MIKAPKITLCLTFALMATLLPYSSEAQTSVSSNPLKFENDFLKTAPESAKASISNTTLQRALWTSMNKEQRENYIRMSHSCPMNAYGIHETSPGLHSFVYKIVLDDKRNNVFTVYRETHNTRSSITSRAHFRLTIKKDPVEQRNTPYLVQSDSEQQTSSFRETLLEFENRAHQYYPENKTIETEVDPRKNVTFIPHGPFKNSP